MFFKVIMYFFYRSEDLLSVILVRSFWHVLGNPLLFYSDTDVISIALELFYFSYRVFFEPFFSYTISAWVGYPRAHKKDASSLSRGTAYLTVFVNFFGYKASVLCQSLRSFWSTLQSFQVSSVLLLFLKKKRFTL